MRLNHLWLLNTYLPTSPNALHFLLMWEAPSRTLEELEDKHAQEAFRFQHSTCQLEFLGWRIPWRALYFPQKGLQGSTWSSFLWDKTRGGWAGLWEGWSAVMNMSNVNVRAHPHSASFTLPAGCRNLSVHSELKKWHFLKNSKPLTSQLNNQNKSHMRKTKK